jgi:hypothetical protein
MDFEDSVSTLKSRQGAGNRRKRNSEGCRERAGSQTCQNLNAALVDLLRLHTLVRGFSPGCQTLRHVAADRTLLNFVPILGPLTGVGVFLLVGIVALDWPWFALLPAALYLSIHIAEGEIITPMLLANRFSLNPVLVIVSLFFWHALWGVPGALLAVPLLAMFKIVCDRVEPLRPAGHIIGA